MKNHIVLVPTSISLKVENYSSLEIITSCIHRDSVANKNRTLAIATEIIFIRYRSAVTLDISEMHLRSQYNLQKSQSIKCTGEIFGIHTTGNQIANQYLNIECSNSLVFYLAMIQNYMK